MYKQVDDRYKWVDDKSGESIIILHDAKNLYVAKRSSPDASGMMTRIFEKKFGNPLNKLQQEKALNYALAKMEILKK